MVINLCEIKFSIKEYEIDKDMDLELRNKIGTFRDTINYKHSIQLTMITSFGLKKGMYNSLASNVVTLDDLFSK